MTDSEDAKSSAKRRPISPGGVSLSTPPRCTVVPSDAPLGRILLDASTWHTADVLLFNAEGAGRFSEVIALVQQPTFGTHSVWTHAALYTGEGQLIEAIAHASRQVVQRSIAAYPPARKVLRLHHPNLTDAERIAIVAHARSLVGIRYAFGEAVILGLRSLGVTTGRKRGRSEKRRNPGPFGHAFMPAWRAVLCSLLVEEAYLSIGETTAPQRPQLLLPAALAESGIFDQHQVGQCQVAP